MGSSHSDLLSLNDIEGDQSCLLFCICCSAQAISQEDGSQHMSELDSAELRAD